MDIIEANGWLRLKGDYVNYIRIGQNTTLCVAKLDDTMSEDNIVSDMFLDNWKFNQTFFLNTFHFQSCPCLIWSLIQPRESIATILDPFIDFVDL